MLRDLKNIFLFLIFNFKGKYIIVQSIIIFSTFLELLVIYLVYIYLSLLLGKQQLLEINFINDFFTYFDFNNKISFITFYGIFLFLIIILNSCFGILRIWLSNYTANIIGSKISKEILSNILGKKYSYHNRNKSADFINQVTHDTYRFSNDVLSHFFQLNSQLLLVIPIIFSLLIINLVNTLVLALLLVLVYLILFLFIKKKISLWGRLITELLQKKINLLQDTFYGIKDLIIYNQRHKPTNLYGKYYENYAVNRTKVSLFTYFPRYLIEGLILGSLILFSIYYFAIKNFDPFEKAPIIGGLAFATLKLLPAFQQIYVSLSQIKSNAVVFFRIKKNLKRKNLIQFKKLKLKTNIKFNSIRLKNLFFSYDNKSKILKKINISFKMGKIVGICGYSGTGKSTLVDNILGLYDETHRNIFIDNKSLREFGLLNWWSQIGYISQNPFILNESVERNIKFGREGNERDQLKKLIKFMNLNFNKNNKKVGELGKNISGGQRQRLALARANYNYPKVIILDEPTSALDSVNESFIIKYISENKKEKITIIITHSKNIIKKCDEVYFFKGKNLIKIGKNKIGKYLK